MSRTADNDRSAGHSDHQIPNADAESSPAMTLFPAEPSAVVRSDAVLSDCGTYRYALMRRWAEGHPLRFVMLNPSTADATVDDPTIRRCIRFAQRDGYAALIVLNLYAFRSPHPKALLTCADPVGPKNDRILWNHLLSAVEGHNPVVAAWGNNAKSERVQRVLAMNPDVDWRCLGTTLGGHPKHPLARGKHRIPDDQPLLPFGSLRQSSHNTGPAA